MSKKVVIVCDERDAEIAESIRAALQGRGSVATIALCDAAAETLGSKGREEIAGAAALVVVVREGGRGNRLLRAIEDEAPAGTAVLPLMADASLDMVVSARTAARVQTLADTITATLGKGISSSPRKKLPRIAAIVVAVAAVAILGTFLWLRFWQSAPFPFRAPPVALTGLLSTSGWIVTFHLPEESSELEYKLPGDASFVSTGDMEPSPALGVVGPRAKPFVVLSGLEGRVPFLVRYRTLNGTERGPYEAVFDTTAEAVSSVKRALGFVPEWISFRVLEGRRLCYFTTLITFKYAIQTIRYGIDSDVLDRTVGFAPSDTPGISPSDQLFIDLPPDASSVTVEVVFRDGTVAGPKRFPFRP